LASRELVAATVAEVVTRSVSSTRLL
jgi:hypothetical protein